MLYKLVLSVTYLISIVTMTTILYKLVLSVTYLISIVTMTTILYKLVLSVTYLISIVTMTVDVSAAGASNSKWHSDTHT